MQSLRHSTQQIASSAFYMLSLVFTVILSVSTYSHGSTVSDEMLKDIAREASIQMAGVDIGNGVVGRRVTAVGRTLMFQYDVVEDWQPFDGAKNTLISALKESGRGDFYFKESIVVMYTYFKKTSAPTVITVKPQELSSVTFQLGDYVSINGHPKSKDINLRMKPPKDWLVGEGNGPNVVKKFTNKNNSFVIITKDAETFFSRSAYKSMYSDESVLKDFVEDIVPCAAENVIGYSLVTIGLYPAIMSEYSCDKEVMGLQTTFFAVSWNILYEDKMIGLMGMAFNKVEFQELKKLYSIVAATTSFPEQFN